MPSAPSTRGERTRARLLEAGAEVFAAKGFHAARVDDMVQTAGTSHGTFYLYFSSKEALLGALVADAAEEVGALIDDMPKLTASDAGRRALRAWLASFADVYERRGAILRTWTETEVAGDGVSQLGADLIGGLAGAVRDKVRIPRRAGLDPEIATLAMITMIERLNYLVTSGQVSADRDELLDTLADAIEGVLFA